MVQPPTIANLVFIDPRHLTARFAAVKPPRRDSFIWRAIWRSRMPVRVTIHSAQRPQPFFQTALVRTCSRIAASTTPSYTCTLSHSATTLPRKRLARWRHRGDSDIICAPAGLRLLPSSSGSNPAGRYRFRCASGNSPRNLSQRDVYRTMTLSPAAILTDRRHYTGRLRTNRSSGFVTNVLITAATTTVFPRPVISLSRKEHSDNPSIVLSVTLPVKPLSHSTSVFRQCNLHSPLGGSL